MMRMKKQKIQKSVIKKYLKFRDFRKYLKASQLENKIIYSEKEKIDVDCLKEDKKKLMKNKLILETHEIFKSGGHNVLLKL